MFIVVGRRLSAPSRGRCTPNSPAIAISLFFTMSRVDFAGEFPRQRINNNGAYRVGKIARHSSYDRSGLAQFFPRGRARSRRVGIAPPGHAALLEGCGMALAA
jgi:hypothetical protein